MSPKIFHHQQPILRVSQENLMSMITYGVSIFLFLASAVIGFSGCANVNQSGQSQQEVIVNSQPEEVSVFFVSGKAAHYLALKSPTSGSVDISAYTHLMEVKYPPTFHVDVLRKAPSRRYKTFAVLECKPGPQSRSEMLESLKKKAREIGADAIILWQGGSEKGLPEMLPTSKMQAVAIRYILTSPSDKGNNS